MVIAVLLGVLGIKLWPTASETQIAQITSPDGPAIVLIRGDNSPSCQAIHRLVEQAEQRYQGRIEVIQTDWSPDNPLIERYQIRFLPAVVFIDSQGNERGKIVGESQAVQEQLAQALAQAEQLLLK
ncbi:hypothetical protein Tel_11315 [Candidatus Tenderia electrophaga]|uniref:Thioredoxin domain-containing protein n=1 Tax=Candidatus Tenderia electrophaga TaxID=1748243 RepID=A0A0S2TF07_9GAMM|nr:hypothetical protein Tel_11315 [Candidatus Tenderia electrophaga]